MNANRDATDKTPNTPSKKTSRPLTVVVPATVVTRAKARAALSGTTVSALVTSFLSGYAADLRSAIDAAAE